MRETQRLGFSGEGRAVTYLRNKGFRILDRNWRCTWGELDIVAEKNRQIHIIEVKTKQSFSGEWISKRQIPHLLRSSLIYLKTHRHSVDRFQIDLIGIYGGETVYLENIVEARL